ncbi:putative O-glycosylation ligase, exosortase A system-associated [Dechloromonas sp. A34]|uniref:putative O-glycosylation ligase, exosortase A system-associated n=1 Tax=Dechloromonas sp. A34 TaxID=447588 RepID=UPI0022493C39|nr:putative O-glycosylation ligase, exosortase A system-associated [Dechloromonas sp. A34]
MRDLLLVGVFFTLWLYCFRYPYIGPLLWAWISMMSPHRLTFSFAFNLPFAQIAAATSLLIFLTTKKKFPFPRSAPAILLVVFFLWCSVTSLVSFNTPSVVFDMWMKVAKIQIMLFVTMMLIGGRKTINLLLAVLSLSVAFYGVKGGIYTLTHGGSGMVWGPSGSFIEGTNHLALAFIMVIPLMYYLLGEQKNVWYRRALMLVIGLTVLATLGTYSRGAFLAAVTMAFFLGMKSKRKALTLGIMATLLVGAVAFLPEQWSNKMSTISTHEDHSAQSRIYTWQMIWNLALHHPITGGGYNVTENMTTWEQYAVTAYAKAYSPHSIYFQALAEHGFVGLFLYLAIGIITWRYASKIANQTRDGPDKDWVPQLMRMIQVSLVGFAAGGFFVNLVNYDLPYYLVAIVAMVGRDVIQSLPKSDQVLASGSVSH